MFGMRVRYVFLIIFVLAVGSRLLGQDFFEDGKAPRFGIINRNDGLDSLSISSIRQDKDGFLWFGTQGGLNRYDGRELTAFTHDPFDVNSIPNDLVQTLFYEREEHALWIGTYSGVSRYDIDSGQFTNYQKLEGTENGLSNNIVTAIAKGPGGNMWVGTLDGLNRLSKRYGTFDQIETAHETIRALLLDSSGRLWIGSYGGLQYWDGDSNSIQTPEIELPSSFVMAISEPEPGRLLIGMWNGGMLEYWPETGKTRSYDLPDDRIYAVLESGDGTKWAGSWGGGLWAQPPAGEAVWFKNAETSELENSVIYSLFEDSSGLVWVGTNGGGVHHLSPRRRNFRAYYHEANNPNSIADGKIEVIHGGSDGNLYLGIYSGGLNRIDKDGSVTKFRHDPDDETSISNDIINCIFEDSKGNFWITTNKGLNRFDTDSEIFETWSEDINPDRPLSHSIVYWITEDDKGRLWIGTYGGGIDRYDPETDTLINFSHNPKDPSSLSDNIVYRILETGDGTVWIATNDGLNRYISDEEGFVHYFHDPYNPETISANNIRPLMEDSQGRLWVGTYSGGINRYDAHQNRFYHYTTKDGLGSNNVLSIVEGNDNRIWLSTRAGINIINPKTEEIDLLDERDGLFGVFFNYGHYKDEDGSIYFGGGHGVTRIDSHTRYINTHLPDVHITGVSILGKAVEHDSSTFDGEELKIQHTENFISFDFVALDYESPRHNKYAYMMEGFDKTWIESGTRSYANYTNLPPGTYTFRVKASNNDNIWNEEGAAMTITVIAPWYRKWWAFVLFALGFLGLATLMLRFREARVLAFQNKELEYTNRLLERANTDLERLSIHDSLTGLYNRRYFDTSFSDELHRAKRARHPLGLLMIDIDHFKQFNDSNGHIAGDTALEKIGGALQQAVPRNTDFVTRYGGEEFAVVLFETDLEGAGQVAENIHRVLRETPIPAGSGETFLSVSIGIHAGIPEHQETPKDFILKADRALYSAKESGRNRTKTSVDDK